MEQVMACVTDTAPNMVKSARFMGFDWMGCMAHQLELITKLAFEGVGVAEALQLARALVGSIKSSSQHAEQLAVELARLGLAVLVVIQDVKTRWWSTHAMVARLMKLKRALQNLHRDGFGLGQKYSLFVLPQTPTKGEPQLVNCYPFTNEKYVQA
jgi:zinc finger BED domain-containing protein 1 (E3 SUMO-protein ligase ZBED1)